jgi:tetratricopeptide (TPR) repeat protein
MFLGVLCASLSVGCFAQQPPQSDPQADQGAEASQAPPRSDQRQARDRGAEAGESSSRDTRIDLRPPKDDAKNHPNTGIVAPETDPSTPDAPSEVQELHPWNPYRAVKDDEVGDYYFKRKNYKAALARYQDALAWKESDAVATFRMAQCYQKLDQTSEAITQYRQYLKILPEGPFSKEAKKALDKLAVPEKSETSQTPPQQ